MPLAYACAGTVHVAQYYQALSCGSLALSAADLISPYLLQQHRLKLELEQLYEQRCYSIDLVLCGQQTYDDMSVYQSAAVTVTIAALVISSDSECAREVNIDHTSRPARVHKVQMLSCDTLQLIHSVSMNGCDML